MSEVTRVVLWTLIPVILVGGLIFVWRESYLAVNAQGQALGMSDMRRSFFEFLTILLGPLGVIIFQLFVPDSNLVTPPQPIPPQNQSHIITGDGINGQQRTLDKETLPPQLEARLVVTRSQVPQLQGKVFNLHQGWHCLGRNPLEQSRVHSLAVSEDVSISGMHAYLLAQGSEQLTVKVLSQYGLWVNQMHLTTGQKTVIRPSDYLTLGNTTFQFQVGKATEQKTYQGTQRLDRQSTPRPAAHLQIVAGPEQGKSISVADRVVIGRSSQAGWQLKDQKVSRQHAEIRRHTSGFILTDLNSSHGVIVNGQSVHRRTLETGDCIRLGDTEIQVTLSV